MLGNGDDRISQRARGGRDVNFAGRDQTVVTAGDHAVVNIGGAGTHNPGAAGLLPRDVPGFTGRKAELTQLISLADGGRVVVSAIGGTAGVGKTALAVHAAHQLLGQFPDGHLYADLHGYTEGQEPAAPGEVLEVFLRRLGVPAKEVPAGVEERSGLLRQILAGRRVLMVLDNARTEAQVRPLLPGTGGSLVLVTSRSVLLGLEADRRITLDILPDDEAVVMLSQVIGADRAAGEPQAVAEVARLCGRLPLALRIAGQLLAVHSAWPVARLTGMLAGEQDRLARLGAGDLQVRAAIEVSYRQLGEGDARLFRLLGLHPGPDFTAGSTAALTGTDPGTAGAGVGRLTEAHLVTEDTAGRFRMHDLLRLYARQTCQLTDNQADREAAEARLVGYYVNLARFLASGVNPKLRSVAERDGGTLPSMREALAVFQAERPGLLAVFGLAAHRGWHQPVLRLSYKMMDALTLLRYFDDLPTVNQAALAAARSAGNRAAEGIILNNLGESYRHLRRFEEAIGCLQQALAIYRETGDRHGEGTALNNLGIALQEVRRFEEATDYCQQALAIFREIGDQRVEGMTLNNLGNAYRELGRSEEAIGWYQEALAIFRETGDRHSEGRVLNNLGNAYQELPKLEEAIGCLQQALAICLEIGDRHSEGRVLNNLGNAYQELPKLEEAIGCLQQALAIFRETGDRHSEGRVLNTLGNAYQELRQFGRAVACWREAAAAMCDTGDHQEAAHLEHLAASAQSRRRRWWRRASRSAKI